jgi:alpha-beta hydrolase superfamily lysophospholipase
MRAAAALALAATLAGCGGPAKPAKLPSHAMVIPQPKVLVDKISIDFDDADHRSIYAVIRTPERPKAVIILCHQAGSSSGEYATIAPWLNAAGYTTMAIDQRAGGTMFGPNLTIADLDKPGTYLEAKGDLDAALDFARSRKLPVILWGSSYSASLAFLVAAERPKEVVAVLAFSPGEYFDDKTLVERAAEKLTVPAYVTSASKPEEIAAAAAIAHAVPRGLATRYVPKTGVHGASTLIADRNPGGAAANWPPVFAFLRKVAP